MNITSPDTNSEIYKKFIGMVNQKISEAVTWLTMHKIDYIWNYWVGNHIYRLYIPYKNLLLDFEYYPMANIEYNYIRVNFDTDVIKLMEKLFPNIIFTTEELDVWKLNQKFANHFLRENDASPIYDKNVLRLGFVKNNTIYQCIILKDNKVIANVVQQNCSIPYGTYILLRYLDEMFGIDEILIKENLDNSYANTIYQILGLPVVAKTNKKKIWWNPEGAKWKIKREDTNKYIPFYYCEDIIYKYKR